MLDKIPSLKDFIIYFIPGSLICYFGLDILHDKFPNSNLVTIFAIGENGVLVFISIIFSFLIGFLFSQLQIIIYNAVLSRKYRKHRTIEASKLPEEFKKQLASQIIKDFKLSITTPEEIIKDMQVLYLCSNYVKIYTNPESHTFINRASNISSLASSMLIPLLLIVWSFLIKLDVSTFLTILILVTTTVLTIFFSLKIVMNFKKEWIQSIYRQYLILSLAKSSS